MATDHSLSSNNSNTILSSPIHLDLSFDLDQALTMNTITTTSTEPDEKIKVDADTNSELVVSNLPTVATDGLCSVCMEDFQTEFGKQVPCGHVFHAKCIATWISLCDSCPLCRSHCIISGHEL